MYAQSRSRPHVREPCSQLPPEVANGRGSVILLTAETLILSQNLYITRLVAGGLSQATEELTNTLISANYIVFIEEFL